jgi:hypothetical protein
MSIGIGAGGGSGNVGGGVGLSIPVGKRTENVALMTIDIVDAKRNAQVWTGSTEERIKGDNASDEAVNAMVGKILARFPNGPSDAPKK